MYPNPQDALPLPPRPSLEQYKKLAKDLVKACRTGGSDAVRAWASTWVAALLARHAGSNALHDEAEIQGRIDQVAQFAARELKTGDGGSHACTLTGAQFVIARAHGFPSWPKFADHVDALVRAASSSISAFEAAADAIVTGEIGTLERLLREQPSLITARSLREHRATLLHYVSANGVENFRQLSPPNIAQIAELLLKSGADVEAEANVYGGGCSTLGLVATSGPPAVAGVQKEVIDVLLAHGARMDRPNIGGNRQLLVHACLANGQPDAAEHLVSLGAGLDLVGAAGIGRMDFVRRFFTDDGALIATESRARLLEAFAIACVYGRVDVVEFLLAHGVTVDAELTGHGQGHTGLHVAAYHGQIEMTRALLAHGAAVDVLDKTWGTPPLIWALTAWSEKRPDGKAKYYDIVTMLVRAGAKVSAETLDWDKARADPRMHAALSAGRDVS